MRLVRNVALAPLTWLRHMPAGALNLSQRIGAIVRLTIDCAHVKSALIGITRPTRARRATLRAGSAVLTLTRPD
jgi:hypothetical protein